ncbi:hypothetical protein T265_06417 [Opisthorchis viverrini]|uniref:Uncharacterized protein n=1 Tax=Opisthorchis viverrini TaxID=6198 RepID=A0A075ADV1_OPIVI|nr:hypothetical protein T265_06417 [Opisthorchis viverrini]KER26299.1 hypothetical protein T265_06417 [Opisthorchis viverrini]
MWNLEWHCLPEGQPDSSEKDSLRSGGLDTLFNCQLIQMEFIYAEEVTQLYPVENVRDENVLFKQADFESRITSFDALRLKLTEWEDQVLE